MKHSKEELILKIEQERRKLDKSIDDKYDYEEIYRNSIALDGLIEQYIVAGF